MGVNMKTHQTPITKVSVPQFTQDPENTWARMSAPCNQAAEVWTRLITAGSVTLIALMVFGAAVSDPEKHHWEKNIGSVSPPLLFQTEPGCVFTETLCRRLKLVDPTTEETTAIGWRSSLQQHDLRSLVLLI